MTSQTIEAKIRILAPADGMALTDGNTYTTGTVYLAWNADASAWREIPESEIPQRDEREPPPRRWSRLAIKTALAQAGMLSQALAYLAIVEIAPGYSAEAALTDCDYVEEGFPNAERWNALLDGAATALGKTRAEIDAFLDNIPQEA